MNESCSKSIETDAVFTETEIDKEWNINFLSDSPLGIRQTYSSKVFNGQSTFWKLVGHYFSCLKEVQIFYSWVEFSV